MKKKFFAFLFFSMPIAAKSLIFKTPEFSATFYGYVIGETFFDTRQIIGFGDNQLLVLPKPKDFDVCGRDINAHGENGITSVETNMGVKMKGPNVRRAKSWGLIEVDFFGTTADFAAEGNIINVLRMRQAYVQLDWDHFSLLGGQTWQPTFVEECFPDTIGFSNGGPIEPYARDPQIRGTFHTKGLDLIFVLAQQLDTPSEGPEGARPKYARNSVCPNINAQIKAFVNKHIIGCSIDFKRLVPRLVTNKDIKVTEHIASWLAMAYVSLRFDGLTISNKFTYAENGTNLSLLGGYAVHTIDPISDERTYTNLRLLSWWTDIAWRKNSLEPGCFFGWGKNIGSSKTIIQHIINQDRIKENLVYGFATDVDSFARISARLRWFLKPFVLGIEAEWTRSTFGSLNTFGRIENARPANNFRSLFALYYYF